MNTNFDMQRPRILIVDDDPGQLEILEQWLGSTGFDPVTAPDGFTAIARLKEGRFDVVVTDLRMPDMGGLQLLSILRELDPGLEVIFLTGQGTLDDAVEALHQGRAFDFLQKPLRDLHQLNVVLDKAIARRRANGHSSGQPEHITCGQAVSTCSRMEASPVLDAPTEPLPAHLDPLSTLELRLVGLLACGHENRRIADELGYSEKTVRNYLSRIYEKLHVASRLQAVAVCQRYGLVQRSALASAS
jgi:DNA-binding NarL/FixJ family response regulator